MCIRDSDGRVEPEEEEVGPGDRDVGLDAAEERVGPHLRDPVSYTHLTLPTIYSV